MRDVPPVVRNEAVALGADAWLDGLPSLVAELKDEWGIAVGGAYPDATGAFGAEATQADGTPAVPKLLVLRPAGAASARDHRAAPGQRRGLRAPPAGRRPPRRPPPRAARASMRDRRLPFEQRQEELCRTAMQVWPPARWEELDRPCTERAVGRSKLVDPDRLLTEPGYDLGILMREDPLELHAADVVAR